MTRVNERNSWKVSKQSKDYAHNAINAMKIQKETETKVITPRTPTTVDVESEPVVTTDIEINWELNKSQACMRRMMKLKLSDKEVSQMLLDPKKRQQFGHMYLKAIKVEV